MNSEIEGRIVDLKGEVLLGNVDAEDKTVLIKNGYNCYCIDTKIVMQTG